MESVLPTKKSIDAKHAQIIWEVRNATNEFDLNRAATNVDLELTRQRNLLRKCFAKIQHQKDIIDDQAELLDENGVYQDDEEEEEDYGDGS